MVSLLSFFLSFPSIPKGGVPTSVKITGFSNNAVGAGFTLPAGTWLILVCVTVKFMYKDLYSNITSKRIFAGTDLNGLYGKSGDGLGGTGIYARRTNAGTYIM